MVSLKEVQKWYSDRVPFIAETIRQSKHYEVRPLRFELWSNGLFHQRALEWLNKQPKIFDRHIVSWKNGVEIKKYSVSAKNKSIRNILNEHYFKHPLTKLNN
jgi:hypothetical protein